MKLVGDNKSEVTCIEQNPKNHTLAVGYLDGSIRIFDLKSQDCLLTFNGHKTSISCLNFDYDGLRLVSGSKDTDIVVWDLIAECGLFRLKGHKGQIMQTVFMKKKNVLISWLVDIRHCFKTIVTHRSEVCDLVLINDERLLTGCHDNQLRVFKIEFKEDQVEGDLDASEKRQKLDENDEDIDEENVRLPHFLF